MDEDREHDADQKTGRDGEVEAPARTLDPDVPGKAPQPRHMGSQGEKSAEPEEQKTEEHEPLGEFSHSSLLYTASRACPKSVMMSS